MSTEILPGVGHDDRTGQIPKTIICCNALKKIKIQNHNVCPATFLVCLKVPVTWSDPGKPFYFCYAYTLSSRSKFVWTERKLIERFHVNEVAGQICPLNEAFDCNKAIFVRPWNENGRTKQKQQTNGNRAIWLVYRTDTNARGFWLVRRKLGWKTSCPKSFLEINRYFALTSYCNTTGQSNNAFSILGLSVAGKRRVHVLIFSSISLRSMAVLVGRTK